MFEYMENVSPNEAENIRKSYSGSVEADLYFANEV